MSVLETQYNELEAEFHAVSEYEGKDRPSRKRKLLRNALVLRNTVREVWEFNSSAEARELFGAEGVGDYPEPNKIMLILTELFASRVWNMRAKPMRVKYCLEVVLELPPESNALC